MRHAVESLGMDLSHSHILACMKPRPAARARIAGYALLAAIATLAAAFLGVTGPRRLAEYPPAASSPYRLPWPAGQTFLCVQSNRGVVSHRGWEEYAYDFKMPEGTPVCAARAGRVVEVVVGHDGHGYKWPNNKIVIEHEDGTRGHYLHLRKGGSFVHVGDRVAQGQVIAESGHVGNSAMPHLHFHVTDAGKRRTLPIAFADLRRDGGVPRMFRYYTAGQ